jgi:sporulation protein YlmC with PRC-barrel domain
LVTAQPVGELERTMRIDNVLGADVRNLQDEDLGDIEDVVLDDQGDLSYVLVGRGGFFGVGQDLVPVRWQDLRAVPDLDTFVLDVDEQAFEQAPAVDRDVFADSDAYAQRRQEIDSYWEEHLQG